jgi:hypothetical protein
VADVAGFQSWLQHVGQGLGQARNALLPVPEEVASQLDPRTIEALRRQAVLQAGLGMMSAGEKGQGLGTGALYGLDQAQQGLGQGLNQAWLGSRARREDARLGMQDVRTQRMEERQATLDRLALENQQGDVAYRQRMEERQAEQDRVRQTERDQDQALENARFNATLSRQTEIEKRALEKEDLQSRRYTSALRKEFRGLPSVKDYETVLPIIESARKAPMTPAGDLQLIYSVGKILDPGSVVREGELQLTQNAQPWLSKMVGQYQKQLKGGSTLPAEIRKQFIAALDERVEGYRLSYERDMDVYTRYAGEGGVDPFSVVGEDLASPYRSPKTGADSAIDVGSVIDVGAAATSGLGQSRGPTTRRKVNW